MIYLFALFVGVLLALLAAAPVAIAVIARAVRQDGMVEEARRD